MKFKQIIKEEMRKVLIIIMLSIFIVIYLTSCVKSMDDIISRPHECQWINCPYKGIYEAQWDNAIKLETESEPNTDAYEVDMIHLQYNKLSYDEIEDVMFKVKQYK